MKDLLKKIVVKYRIMTKGTPVTVKDLADFLKGTVIGRGNIFVKDLKYYTFAKEGDLTFAGTEEELKNASESTASGVITTLEVPEGYPKTVLKVEDLKYAMVVIHNALEEMLPPKKGHISCKAVISGRAKLGRNVSIGPYAVIKKNAKIGANTSIGAHAVIGKDVTIGPLCTIHTNVSVYPQTIMGKKVIVHSGAVIGADGFGFVPKDGKIYKVPQAGHVIIGDNVEIGANTCIDRGTFDNTVIGDGTKIDNLVQIAHNAKIGKNVLIAGLSGLAGSCEIGDNTMMGGGVGVSDHVRVGKDVKVGAKTGVHGHVKEGMTVFGYPYREAQEARKLYALLSILVRHSVKLRRFVRNLPDENQK